MPPKFHQPFRLIGIYLVLFTVHLEALAMDNSESAAPKYLWKFDYFDFIKPHSLIESSVIKGLDANSFFDDGEDINRETTLKMINGVIKGLRNHWTGEPEEYRRVDQRLDGSEINDTHILPGRGIYRKKKGLGYFVKVSPDNTIHLDWYGPKQKNSLNDSPLIQKAIDDAGGTKLVFNKGKKYYFTGIKLRSNTIIDGNQAQIKPFKGSVSNDESLFIISTAPSPREKGNVHNVQISGFRVDLEYLPINFVRISSHVKNHHIRDVRISKNEVVNCSKNAIWLSEATKIIDASNGYIKNTFIENNKIINSGPFIQCVVDSTYNIGSKSIAIVSNNDEPIANKIVVGKYIQFSTGLSNKMDLNTATSAAVYRVKDFTKDSSNNKRGTVLIESGIYSKEVGFISTPDGLKATLYKGSWIIPTFKYEYPNLQRLPKLTGKKGSSIVEVSNVDDAFGNNLYVGCKFVFGRSGPRGVYTITSLDNGNNIFEVDPAMPMTFADVEVFGSADPGNCIRVDGNCMNVQIINNFLSGGEHGFFGKGASGKNLVWNNLKGSTIFRGNLFEYFWMSCEIIAAANYSNPIDLGLITTQKGKKSFSARHPSRFNTRIIDVDKDGKVEKVLVSAALSNEKITTKNSLMEGDWLFFSNTKSTYIVKDINSPSNICIEQLDTKNNRTLALGFANSSTDNIVKRVFSRLEGCTGAFGELSFFNNIFKYSIRPTGGYHISAVAKTILISKKNKFTNRERTSLELTAGNTVIDDNIFRQELWERKNNISTYPGSVSGDATGKRGAGNLVATESNRFYFTNNIIDIDQADNSTYSPQAGAIVLYKRKMNPYGNKVFEVKDNIIRNLPGRLVFTPGRAINGINYSPINYDSVQIRRNKVYLSKSNLGELLYPFGGNFSFSNNLIVHPGNPKQYLLAGKEGNPELYNLDSFKRWIVQNNDYNFHQMLLTPELRLKINYLGH